MNTFILLGILSLNQGGEIIPKDSLNPNKKAIKTYFFKQTLSIRNACLKFAYGLNKKPRKINDTTLERSGWILSFHDEFDSLDIKKWRLGQPWGEYHPGHPHQYYSNEMISVENGFLHLRGSYQPKTFRSGDSNITIPYAIGLINSDISFKQKYGYFEIRSKNPKGPATWPAFWLTGATKWPPEIDIFEMYGKSKGKHIHNQYATIHYGKSDTKSRGYLSKKVNLPNNTDTAFHIYGCEWTPDYIRFFTDGKQVAYIRMNKSLRKWMDEEMVVIINNSFEEKYLSSYADKTKVNNDFVVDWVRVYMKI